MKINKVITLNEFEYVEKEVNSIYPNWDTNITSTHTINHVGKLTVIDGVFKRKVFFN